MFCSLFHKWTDWQAYTATANNKIDAVEALQFRDCRGCNKRQLEGIKIRRRLNAKKFFGRTT